MSFVFSSIATFLEISKPKTAKTSLPLASNTSESLFLSGTFLSVKKSPMLFVPPPTILTYTSPMLNILIIRGISWR